MRQTTNKHRWLSFILCLALLAGMALLTIGCNQPQQDGVERQFTLLVVDKEGTETSFSIKTTKGTVGDALVAEGLLEGTEGQYVLYVEKVNGIVADYNTDGTYWAFYINGKLAPTGVDLTNVEDGATYMLKVEKG